MSNSGLSAYELQVRAIARRRRRNRYFLAAYVATAFALFGYAWTGPCDTSSRGQLDPMPTFFCSAGLAVGWPVVVPLVLSVKAWRSAPRLSVEVK